MHVGNSHACEAVTNNYEGHNHVRRERRSTRMRAIFEAMDEDGSGKEDY